MALYSRKGSLMTVKQWIEFIVLVLATLVVVGILLLIIVATNSPVVPR